MKKERKKDEKMTTREELRAYFRNIKRIIGMVFRGHPLVTVVLIVLTIILAFNTFASNASLSYLVDTIASGNAFDAILIALGIFLLVKFIPMLLGTFNTYFEMVLWFRLEHFFQMIFLRKRASLDAARYEDKEFQDLLNKATDRGTWPIRQLFDRLFQMTYSIVGLVTATISLLVINPLYFGLIIVAVAPVFLVEFTFGREVYSVFDWNADKRRIHKDRSDYLIKKESLIELKMFGAVKKMLGIVDSIMTEYVEEQASVEKKKLWWQLFAIVWLLLLQGAAIVLVAYHATIGIIGVGLVLFVLTLIVQLQESIRMFLMNIANQRHMNLIVTDIFKFLDTKPLISEPEDIQEIDTDKTPTITFENVTFSYPFGDSGEVLKNINLEITAGEKVAIIGVNGAGKSTFTKLLCRFYDPTEGRILVNGIDIKRIKTDDLYKILSVLTQDFATYKFKVDEGTALSRDGQIKGDEIIESAISSGADEFIKEYENQYSQQIGTEFKGVDPSGGQKQRLALARVMYAKPRVLILDEPTSAVDAEAEAKIFEGLEDWAKEKTLILISHRFSTVRNVDRIIVLKDGKIHEDGSHEDLLEKNGTYADLFKKQAKGYL